MLKEVAKSFNPCENVFKWEAAQDQPGKWIYKGIAWNRVGHKAAWSVGLAAIACVLLVIAYLARQGGTLAGLNERAIIAMEACGAALILINLFYTMFWGLLLTLGDRERGLENKQQTSYSIN